MYQLMKKTVMAPLIENKTLLYKWRYTVYLISPNAEKYQYILAILTSSDLKG